MPLLHHRPGSFLFVWSQTYVCSMKIRCDVKLNLNLYLIGLQKRNLQEKPATLDQSLSERGFPGEIFDWFAQWYPLVSNVSQDKFLLAKNENQNKIHRPCVTSSNKQERDCIYIKYLL